MHIPITSMNHANKASIESGLFGSEAKFDESTKVVLARLASAKKVANVMNSARNSSRNSLQIAH